MRIALELNPADAARVDELVERFKLRGPEPAMRLALRLAHRRMRDLEAERAARADAERAMASEAR